MPAPAQCGAVQRSERTLPCPAHPQRRTRQALGASGWTRFTGSSRAASISGLCRRLAAGASAPVRMRMHRALPDARHDICGHLRADRPRALAATIDGLHRRPIQVRDHSSSLVPATLCRHRAGDPPRERFSTSPPPHSLGGPASRRCAWPYLYGRRRQTQRSPCRAAAGAPASRPTRSPPCTPRGSPAPGVIGADLRLRPEQPRLALLRLMRLDRERRRRSSSSSACG